MWVRFPLWLLWIASERSATPLLAGYGCKPIQVRILGYPLRCNSTVEGSPVKGEVGGSNPPASALGSWLDREGACLASRFMWVQIPPNPLQRVADKGTLKGEYAGSSPAALEHDDMTERQGQRLQSACTQVRILVSSSTQGRRGRKGARRAVTPTSSDTLGSIPRSLTAGLRGAGPGS